MTFTRRTARAPAAVAFAKRQRHTANEFAARVWQSLRNRRCCAAKFRREYAIPPYTADFCCVEHRLIVEVDGKGHFTEKRILLDVQRDRFLLGLGFNIFRVRGFDVLQDGIGRERDPRSFVRDAIQSAYPSPPDPLSPQRGEGEKEKRDEVVR